MKPMKMTEYSCNMKPDASLNKSNIMQDEYIKRSEFMRLMSISIMKQVFKKTYDYLISSPAYNLSQNLLKL